METSLIRSFLLSSTRQDWSSNTTYMKNKRISPAVSFVTIKLSKLQDVTESSQKDFLASVCARLISPLTDFYLSLLPSRIRLSQWKLDLHFLFTYTLFFLNNIFCRYEIGSTEAAALNEIFDSLVFLLFVLVVTQENSYSELRLLVLRCLSRSGAERSLHSLFELKERVGAMSAAVSRLLPTARIGDVSVKFDEAFSVYHGLSSITPHLPENFILKFRAVFIDEITKMDVCSLSSFLELPLRDEKGGIIGLVCRLINKRAEMIEGTYPPLSPTQIEMQQQLTLLLDEIRQL